MIEIRSEIRSEVPSPEAHIDIFRLMVKEGQYDPMEQADGVSVMHLFRGSPIVYRWLLDQEEFIIDYGQPSSLHCESIAGALISSHQLDSSSCLEAAITRGSDMTDPGGSGSLGQTLSLPHRASFSLAVEGLADLVDFPKRVKVLWDAGADFHTLHDICGTALDTLFEASFFIRREDVHLKHKVEREPIPVPPLTSAEDILEYDRLQDIAHIKARPRTPKSLWHKWWHNRCPGVERCPMIELSTMEVVQRHLDAWMDVLLEAGLDIAEYGRREEQLHPEGLLVNKYAEARLYFEYGEHVGGCRIHVTEIWVLDRNNHYKTAATGPEIAKMPCSWDFEDT